MHEFIRQAQRAAIVIVLVTSFSFAPIFPESALAASGGFVASAQAWVERVAGWFPGLFRKEAPPPRETFPTTITIVREEIPEPRPVWPSDASAPANAPTIIQRITEVVPGPAAIVVGVPMDLFNHQVDAIYDSMSDADSALGRRISALSEAVTTASATITNLVATTLTVSGTGTFDTASTTSLIISGASNGLLKTNASGAVSVATAGTDYENPLTFAYPFTRSSNAVSLAFGTTTANEWGALQKFTNASSTRLSAAFAEFGGTATTTFTMDGKAGVGTTSPWAQLSVNPTSANGSAPAFVIGSSTGTSLVVTNGGYVGIGTPAPTALLHLRAGTSSAAPLKLSSGGLLTAPETGSVEYDGTHFYGTVGSIRHQLDQQASLGLNSSKGVVLGDSTIASYLGQNEVGYYLLTSSDGLIGTTVTTLAQPGHTIDQQKALWTADSNKATYDWIIVQVGLNDLLYSESAATALARYQSLIDTINAEKKASAVVVVATMTPLKQRLIDLYGASNGAISYQKWLDMNVAIMGGGANAITGVQYRVHNHTTELDDGTGNLAAIYNIDNVHENNAARVIIASAWRAALNRAEYLGSVSPSDTLNYWNSNGSVTSLKSGTVGIGITTSLAKLAVKGDGASTGLLAQFSDSADTARLTLRDNGYLSVGTTSSVLPVTMQYSGTPTYRTIASNLLLKGTVAGLMMESDTGASGMYDYNGNTVFYSHSGAGNITSADIRLVINQTTGNVGIGTTSPFAKLAVTGNLAVGSAGSDTLFVDGSGRYVGIRTTAPAVPLAVNGNARFNGSVTLSANGLSAGNLATVSYDNQDLTLSTTGGTGHILFTPVGNVGIGTTSPWRKLSVTGTVGFDGLTGSTGAGSLCLDANKQVVYNSASDSCLSSTRATKHDIQDQTLDELAAVNALAPVSFVYNTGDTRTRFGFIAEDAAAVDPHLATYDANGNISGIDDRAIVSVVVGAIKQLWQYVTTRFDAQDARITELEAEVAALKDELDIDNDGNNAPSDDAPPDETPSQAPSGNDAPATDGETPDEAASPSGSETEPDQPDAGGDETQELPADGAENAVDDGSGSPSPDPLPAAES
ncbi:tail fiber domain-containing protein [Emcibacter sp. SYSU 3D8]|uniref:GDSL-type esterase/lipase family protein n=1 Tax=Emcibacter sp. SYSU 3D8 TaxID=3133969 RepID=UPI0031FF175D